MSSASRRPARASGGGGSSARSGSGAQGDERRRSARAKVARRFNAMHRQPLFDVGDVEAKQRSDLVEGNAPFVHQAPDEPLRHPEPRRKLDDIEHSLPLRRPAVPFPCHLPQRESPREIGELCSWTRMQPEQVLGRRSAGSRSRSSSSPPPNSGFAHERTCERAACARLFGVSGQSAVTADGVNRARPGSQVAPRSPRRCSSWPRFSIGSLTGTR